MGASITFDSLINESEKTMDTICAAVANGGSLIDLCETWSVGFGQMINWIRKDDDRNRRYKEACNDRADWSIERVLVELRRIGMSDIRDIYDNQGHIKDVKDWPSEISSIIKSFDAVVDKDGDRIFKVTFWNKEKALELLGKNMQMFTEKINVDGTITLEDLVNQSREEG